jgi:hypothetical protein
VHADLKAENNSLCFVEVMAELRQHTAPHARRAGLR